MFLLYHVGLYHAYFFVRCCPTFLDCQIESFPKIIVLTCDETCNLRCPSCRTHVKALDSHGSECLQAMLMEKVRPMLNSCERIDMLSCGEVFASRACLAFLKTLSLKEFPQLKIRLLTNAQLFTVQKWNEYKNLHDFPLIFHVSIDAAEKETYETLRLGGKWETLLENMEFISSLRKKGNICDLTISMVVQKANYRQMPAFVELAKKWHADTVHFQHMTNWGTQSTEDYEANNVFSEKNPAQEEATAILNEIVCTASGLKVLQNIIDVQ